MMEMVKGEKKGRYLGTSTPVISFTSFRFITQPTANCPSPVFEPCWWEFKYCPKSRLQEETPRSLNTVYSDNCLLNRKSLHPGHSPCTCLYFTSSVIGHFLLQNSSFVNCFPLPPKDVNERIYACNNDT